MEINTPLHSLFHIWFIGAVIVAGALAVVLNKLYVLHHQKNEKATNTVLIVMYGNR